MKATRAIAVTIIATLCALTTEGDEPARRYDAGRGVSVMVPSYVILPTDSPTESADRREPDGRQLELVVTFVSYRDAVRRPRATSEALRSQLASAEDQPLSVVAQAMDRSDEPLLIEWDDTYQASESYQRIQVDGGIEAEAWFTASAEAGLAPEAFGVIVGVPVSDGILGILLEYFDPEYTYFESLPDLFETTEAGHRWRATAGPNDLYRAIFLSEESGLLGGLQARMREAVAMLLDSIALEDSK